MNILNSRTIKIVSLFSVLIFILNITQKANAKYLAEETYIVAHVNIDVSAPKIELIDIKSEIKEDMNQTSIIDIELKLTEKNILKNNFTKESIEILVADKAVIPHFYEVKEIQKENEFILYQLKIKGIKEKGYLNLKIKEGCVIDKSQNFNKEVILKTNIIL